MNMNDSVNERLTVIVSGSERHSAPDQEAGFILAHLQR